MALAVLIRRTLDIQGPSMSSRFPRRFLLLSSLTLRAWLIHHLASSRLMPISLALKIAAATGPLERPDMQCTYALSPCLTELITQSMISSMSYALFLEFDISHRRASAPGIRIPRWSRLLSTVCVSLSAEKQYICILCLV